MTLPPYARSGYNEMAPACLTTRGPAHTSNEGEDVHQSTDAAFVARLHLSGEGA